MSTHNPSWQFWPWLTGSLGGDDARLAAQAVPLARVGRHLDQVPGVRQQLGDDRLVQVPAEGVVVALWAAGDGLIIAVHLNVVDLVAADLPIGLLGFLPLHKDARGVDGLHLQLPGLSRDCWKPPHCETGLEHVHIIPHNEGVGGRPEGRGEEGGGGGQDMEGKGTVAHSDMFHYKGGEGVGGGGGNGSVRNVGTPVVLGSQNATGQMHFTLYI